MLFYNMDKQIFSLAVIAFLIVILGSLYYYIIKEQEGIDPGHVNSLGNRMSDYFADIGLAFYDGKDFEDVSFNAEDNPLYPYVPHKIQLNTEIQKQLKSAISQESMESIRDHRRNTASWVVINDDFYEFWTIMKPTVHKILSDMFEKLELNQKVEWPILYYRCSDVPFWRMPHYHIQRFQYYRDTLNEIKDKGINIKKVLILYNGSHQASTENKAACDKYIQMLQEYLQNMGIETEITSASNVEDFAKMFYAPAVISTGSSYSFTSAFFGDGLFITAPSEPVENCKENCKWIKSQYNIEHDDVPSYHDIDDMKTRFLQEKFKTK
jgi:hypothetical protein